MSEYNKPRICIYKGTRELLEDALSELRAVNSRLAKHTADMDYIAMMTDVDLEEGDEDVEEI